MFFNACSFNSAWQGTGVENSPGSTFTSLCFLAQTTSAQAEGQSTAQHPSVTEYSTAFHFPWPHDSPRPSASKSATLKSPSRCNQPSLVQGFPIGKGCVLKGKPSEHARAPVTRLQHNQQKYSKQHGTCRRRYHGIPCTWLSRQCLLASAAAAAAHVPNPALQQHEQPPQPALALRSFCWSSSSWGCASCATPGRQHWASPAVGSAPCASPRLVGDHCMSAHCVHGMWRGEAAGARARPAAQAKAAAPCGRAAHAARAARAARAGRPLRNNTRPPARAGLQAAGADAALRGRGHHPARGVGLHLGRWRCGAWHEGDEGQRAPGAQAAHVGRVACGPPGDVTLDACVFAAGCQRLRRPQGKQRLAVSVGVGWGDGTGAQEMVAALGKPRQQQHRRCRCTHATPHLHHPAHS